MPRKCKIIGNSKRKRSARAKLLVLQRWKNEVDGDNREINVGPGLFENEHECLGLNVQTQIVDEPMPSCSLTESNVSNGRPGLEPTDEVTPQRFTRPSTSNTNNGITIGLNTTNDIDEVDDSFGHRPTAETTPKQSASATKASRMSYSRPTPQPTDNTGSEFILVQHKALSSLVHTFQCCECFQSGLIVDISERAGFATKLSVVCTHCSHVQSQTHSSDRESEDLVGSRSSRPPYRVNKLMTEAFCSFGKGHAAMERFSSCMNMHTLSVSSYNAHLHSVATSVMAAANISLKKAREEVRKAHIELSPDLANTAILKITVSYDGSWHKRGHTSTMGIGCVIDILTGLVIDYEVLCKYCHTCILAERDLGKGSPEFDEWMIGHQGNCDKNFDGSSGAMETKIAEILWKRSENVCQMQYICMLSDGDAKAFQHLQQMKVYGEEVTLEKEECINHVSKRLGTGLRNLVKDWKTKGITLGGKKQGSLTDAKIKKLQNYYSHAIKSNAPDINKVKLAVYATLSHSMSTDETPKHEKCPTGDKSWCFYNRAIAKQEIPPSHVEKVGTSLNKDVVIKLMPLYQRLASDELLRRCMSGKTQNANECLHSVIWNKCPKETFVGKRKLSMAVASGVSEFNQGRYETARSYSTIFGKSPGCRTVKISRAQDMRRLQQSTRRMTASYKSKQKAKKYHNNRQEKKKKMDEGPTYVAGGF